MPSSFSIGCYLIVSQAFYFLHTKVPTIILFFYKNLYLFQDPLNPQETVIVLRSLVPGGVAQKDGRLIPGDRLLSVNDIAVEHITLDKAVQILKSTPRGAVKITVAKPLACGDAISNTSQVCKYIFI